MLNTLGESAPTRAAVAQSVDFLKSVLAPKRWAKKSRKRTVRREHRTEVALYRKKKHLMGVWKILMYAKLFSADD
jgi:hypothetical protein